MTRVQTFEEARVLTEDRGLVVTMSDGSEYQVTIAASWGVGADAWGPLRGLSPFSGVALGSDEYLLYRIEGARNSH